MSRPNHPDRIHLAPAGATMGGPAGPSLLDRIDPEPVPMPREQRAELDEAIAQIAANEPKNANQAGPAASGTAGDHLRAMEALADALSAGRTSGPARDVDMTPPRSRIVRLDRGGVAR